MAATVVRFAQRERLVIALDVATGREQILAKTPGPVWQLSPPDRRGALVILTPGAADGRFAVQLVRDGRQRLVLDGQGDPLWDDPLGAPALSEDGTWWLAVAQPVPEARFQPLFVGTLRCWSTGDGQQRILGPAPVLALGQRPAWSSDGRAVVYAAPGPQGRAAPTAPAPTLQPDPQVRRLDLATGREEVLVSGHQPVLSSDDRSMLFRPPGARGWFWWDLTGATAREMPPPVAGLRVPLALVESRFLIYTGEPQAGAPSGVTRRNSPLAGPKALLALKVADLVTGASETLLDGVDPREPLAARAGAMAGPGEPTPVPGAQGQP